MRLLRIQTELYGRPLLITREGFDTIHSVVQAKLRGEKPGFLKKLFAQEDDMDDMEDSCPCEMSIEGGVAWIPISGPIGKKVSLLEKVSGVCDVDELREQIDMARTNPDVECICFEVDSPGGSVAGVPDLAEYIKDINDNEIPCYALIDGMNCSAAYFLTAGCKEIYAIGKTSYTGAIGVYTYALDMSRMYKNEGVEPVLIKAGENKGEMLPGMPIDEVTKARLQKEVDYIYKMFSEHVAACRPMVEKGTMQGHAYFAEEALTLGLIDGIVGSKKELFPQD